MRLSPVLLALLLATPLAPAEAAPPRRVAVISCDGLGDALAERLLAAGAMPNLDRLRREGVEAAYSRANFATKTAAGHAALWTGAYGAINGVSGNQVPLSPRAEHTILETRSGFSSVNLTAEPVFAAAARQGKRVIGLNIPQSFPASTYAPGGAFGTGVEDRLTLLNGFEGRRGEEAVWTEAAGLAPAAGLGAGEIPVLESRQELAGRPFFTFLLDDPADPKAGYDTLVVARERSLASPLARLKPAAPGAGDAAWSAAVPVLAKGELTHVQFRLFDLDPAGKRFMLYHTQPSRLLSNRPAWTSAYHQSGAGFVEGGAAKSYGAGKFGLTLPEGGDGLAERRYMETVRFALSRQAEGARWLVTKRPWDLLLNYVPFPDEAVHMWYGYLMPGSPAYDAKLAARLWPTMLEIARALDGYLGAVRQAIGPEAAMLVVSDHGMEPLRWTFQPNVVLKEAGLLALNADGKVDLSRTKAMYASADSSYVVVNTTDRKGGIVPPAGKAAVLAAVRKALSGYRATEQGKPVPVVTGYLEPTAALSRELGVGGAPGGDLYLDLRRGYYLAAGTSGAALRTRPANTAGGHMLDPRRPDLHAVFFAAGPGLKRGATIGGIRQIDVAPTVTRLLGIQPPAQATGRVLTEALR